MPFSTRGSRPVRTRDQSECTYSIASLASSRMLNLGSIGDLPFGEDQAILRRPLEVLAKYSLILILPLDIAYWRAKLNAPGSFEAPW